jgi:hypothetical protein
VTIPFTGGCACGAVRYECGAEPVMALNCHCRDCQRASGTAYASGMIVSADAFRFTKGAPKYHEGRADSGREVGRGFCADCGSPVVATQAGYPMFIVHASSLDDPSWHRPTLDVFTASAQPWDHLDPALPKLPRGLEARAGPAFRLRRGRRAAPPRPRPPRA